MPRVTAHATPRVGEVDGERHEQQRRDQHQIAKALQ
jgi:hypothetical protein